ncbi:ORF033 [Staphylococcus phage 71]|uniref:ORF033 n=1 Tax=Staphylococcus phage 71 TaxID=2936816 RepID=Q4ZBG3_9CAUD|nr:ORF033 [Staphylococcus phage 71]AAX91603.1 ORF033 [Staphylococcus phage 71]
MTNIDWIITSNRVFNNPSNNLLIDEPITSISLFNVPSQYTFTISFGISNIDLNDVQTINLRIGNLDTEKEIVNAPLYIDKAKENEVKNKRANGLVDFVSTVTLNNFLFEETGNHYITMKLGESIQTCYFNVMLNQELEDGK